MRKGKRIMCHVDHIIELARGPGYNVRVRPTLLGWVLRREHPTLGTLRLHSDRKKPGYMKSYSG